MNIISRFIFILLCAISLQASGQSISDYVNPMIGTDGHGHTFPGAIVPFGMVQLSPDTRDDGSWDGCSGYHFSDKKIIGFSHTHLSGTGCSDYGDILLMPITHAIPLKKGGYASAFQHKNEKAKAGYYEVLLDREKIKVELTATERVGIHQYTYANTDSQYVVIDLSHRDEVLDSEIEIIYPNQVAGYRRSKAWATEQNICFDIRFSKPIKNIVFYNNDSISQKPYQKGKNIKAIIYFGNDNEPLVAKCGLSGVSTKNASENLEAETKNSFSFSSFKKDAIKKWEKALSVVTIEDAKSTTTESNKIKFYTALYHCLTAPNLFSDVDGSYLGRDKKVHNTGKKI